MLSTGALPAGKNLAQHEAKCSPPHLVLGLRICLSLYALLNNKDKFTLEQAMKDQMRLKV
jgi:hypothetical protein